MRKSILFTVLVLVLCISNALGQRVHSSQFYSNPMLLNPALTGNSDYQLRAGINYRNQWNSVTVPFVSQNAFVDGKLNSTFLVEKSWIGIGGMLFSDKAGSGGLKTNQLTLSSSFNKSLNRRNSMLLSFGLTAEITNKAIDYHKLVFDDQWNENFFDPGQTTQEDINSRSLFYVDLSFGTMFSYYQDKRHRYYMGVAVGHINQPNESFYNVTNNLKTRFIAHAGADIKFSQRMSITPDFIHITEKGASEWVLGSNMQLRVGRNGVVMHYGMRYRFTQDIIPNFGVEKDKYKFMISYDVNVSQLSRASSYRGGFELSFIFQNKYSDRRKLRHVRRNRNVKKLGNKALSCPKFTNK
ncbi:MAG: PorP/SprF family type IX secretion system membrane protein [Marinifilaceae bacterium]|jgi:type IX secretion system PorP/SprF family membrane protein|nr:PorP/SprF family type IX secretion system membrane protein [Marinifilaceae bacterium]